MTQVKFNDKITYYNIPYYDRYNWDLIDSIRKRDKIINRWKQLINKLINKN
jgi:hypothetical protein